MSCKSCEEKAANRMKNISNTKAFDFSLTMRFAVSAKIYLEQCVKLGDMTSAAKEGIQCFECLIDILNGEPTSGEIITKLDKLTKELIEKSKE